MKAEILMLFSCILMLIFAPAARPQALGDVARAQREQRSKQANTVTKVYTNENLPARPREEGPTAADGIAASASTEATAKPESAQGAARPNSADSDGHSPQNGPAPQHETSHDESGTKPEKPEDKIKTPEDKTKTKDYWQNTFKAARAQLAKAEEERQLVEDELQLLQIQQAREIAPDVQAEVAKKIEVKKIELDERTAATTKAQKNLADLEEEFKQSGAPEEWGQKPGPEGSSQ